MANIPLKSIITFFFLALAITLATSARLLEEELPSGTTPAAGGTTVAGGIGGSTTGGATVAGGVGGSTTGGATVAGGIGGSTTAAAVAGSIGDGNTLSFFMHDILGGTNPSARAVTGIVTNPAVNGQIPFAKPNGAVNSNGNNDIINSNGNNLPFLTGLGGPNSNGIQNNNNNNNNNNGFFNLPTGANLQRLMFGTMTVIDDELTLGHELASGLVGKAQGFYVSSAVDGSSQTMAITAMFESGRYADSISFFGVHRTATSESQLAVMGGTGKYVNAKGYATVKTIPFSPGQHDTDGIETVLEFIVYLTY